MISAGLHTNPSNPSKATLVETKLSVSPFIKIYRFGGIFFFFIKSPVVLSVRHSPFTGLMKRVLRRMFCTVSAAKSPANTRRRAMCQRAEFHFPFCLVESEQLVDVMSFTFQSNCFSQRRKKSSLTSANLC